MYYHSIRICCQIPVHTEKKTAPRGTQFHKTDLYQLINNSEYLDQFFKTITEAGKCISTMAI